MDRILNAAKAIVGGLVAAFAPALLDATTSLQGSDDPAVQAIAGVVAFLVVYFTKNRELPAKPNPADAP